MNLNHTTETLPITCIGSESPKALVLGGGIPAMVAAHALRDLGMDTTLMRFRETSAHVYHAEPGSALDRDSLDVAWDLDDVRAIVLERAPVVLRRRRQVQGPV